MKHEVCIITDAGIDDILAIAFLSVCPNIIINKIVAVSGNGSAHQAQSNIQHFLPECADKTFSWTNDSFTSAVPVHLIHGSNGLGEERVHLSKEKPIELVELREHCHETIVSLAPLTLLSKLLDLDKDSFGRSQEILIMGGALENGIGNDSPFSEYNFQVDPSAANNFFRSECYPTVIPLDVTRRILFGNELSNVLPSSINSIFMFLRAKYRNLGQLEIPLHDLTAVSYLIAPDAFTLQHRYSSIMTGRDEFSGALFIDQHMYSRKPANCLIAKDAECSRIKYEIVHAFNSSLNK